MKLCLLHIFYASLMSTSDPKASYLIWFLFIQSDKALRVSSHQRLGSDEAPHSNLNTVFTQCSEHSMRLSAFHAVIGVIYASLASAHQQCNNSRDQTQCTWFGESPICGMMSRSVTIGEWDGDHTLVAWTKLSSALDLRNQGIISQSCFLQYGSTCLTGYKRLWCKASSSWEANEV